ncbi:unnamed protein product [Aphanomyces euteiches]
MARRGGYDDDDDDDMLLKALQMSEPCGNCGKDGAQIPCMSGCGEVFYCSRVRHSNAMGYLMLLYRNATCSMHHPIACGVEICAAPSLTTTNVSLRSIWSTLIHLVAEEDDSDESYDDSDSDDDSSEEERPPPPPVSSKGKGSSKGNSSRRDSVGKKKEGGGGGGGGGGRVRVDSEIERRIEEKILRRLKKQEENRIAQAIEAQMAQANANWTDEDMNRIAMEVKNRLQKEMGHMFMNGSSRSRKNSVARDSLFNSSRQINTIAEEKPSPPPAPNAERSVSREPSRAPQQKASADGGANGKTISVSSSSRNIAVDMPSIKETPAAPESSRRPPPIESSGSSRTITVDAAGEAAPPPGTPPSWNNKCAAFLSLKIVVWKLDFLPTLKFGPNNIDGTWNRVVEVDADESFSHVVAGDLLMSLNGQLLTGVAMSESDIEDMFQMVSGGHLILKFSTTQAVNTHVREYSVRWGNGPLGLTLKDDGSPEALPIVHRLTKKPGSVAVKENIAIGDVLCSINNIDTVQLGCALTMSVLKKVQLPATLTFRGVGGGVSNDSSTKSSPAPEATLSRQASSSSTAGGIYTIDWTVGPLGLTIIPGISAGDLPVIKRVTGKGESPGIDSAQVGDFLLSVNGKSAATMSFESIVEMMKSLPKPIHLEFRSSKRSKSSSPPPPQQPAVEVSRRAAPPAKETPAPSSVRSAPPASAPSSVRSAPPASAPSSVRSAPPAQADKGEIDIDIPVGTYSLVWGPEGPLGLTIDAIPHATGAFIKRSSGSGASAHLSNDCVGDEMTHINDIDVTQMDYGRIVTYLKKVPRPVTLRFKKDNIVGRDSATRMSIPSAPVARQDSSLRPASASSLPTPSASSSYDLSWTEGSLGLSLHAADEKSEYPYITRVTGTGCAAHLPNSVVGDQLRSINGNSCHGSRMTFNDIMEMLKTLPKPIQLRFHKIEASPRLAPRSNSGSGTMNTGSSGGGNNTLLSANGSVNTSGGNGTILSSNGSFNTGGGDEDPTSGPHNMLTPFAGGPKLSTGRRQKIVKQLKK